MQARHREEVLNTVLAACLGSRGIDADPETILQKGRIKPDVIALFRGLRCAIEGKVADVPRAKDVVLGDARKRVEQAVAHLAIAVVYPAPIRSVAFARLPKELSSAELEFAVLTEAGGGDWHTGGINEILGELRRAHEVIVRDDVLQQAVDTLTIGLAEVANALLGQKGACERLIDVLGIGGKADAAAV
jgi:hypothetical protein